MKNTIQEHTSSSKKQQGGVPGCWPLFLVPFACGGTSIEVQNLRVLFYIWSHPTISSYSGGFYRVGRYYYPVPPQLPASPVIMESVRQTLLWSALLHVLFGVVLTVIWIVILAWLCSIVFYNAASKKPAEQETDRFDVIPFTWRGKVYVVAYTAYTQDMHILLPDRTLLRPDNGWFETEPPVPQGLVEVEYRITKDEPLEKLARRLNACLARER